MKKYFVTIFYFLSLLLLWQLIAVYKLISPSIIPSPSEFFIALPSLLSKDEFLPDVISTLTRSSIAFILSVPIGIIIGYLIFYSKWFRQPNEFLLDFVRSIPSTALIPLFMISFGIGDVTKIAVGIFSSSLIICISTIQGLKSRNITRLTVSKIAGFSNIKRFLYLDIPESLSQIFVGLRAGVSLSLILVVVSEMFIGSNNGLGKVINDMRYSDAIPKLYCALFATGLIGYFYNIILINIENKIFHWKGNI